MYPPTCSSISLCTSSNKHHPPKTIKSSQPSYLDSLYSIHKPLQKQTTKHYIAPFLPTPPKIYKINASNFKDVVRELTSMPEFQYPSKRSLKDIAPPPLDLYTLLKPSLFPKPSSEDGGEMESPLSDFIISTDFCIPISEPTYSPPSFEDGEMKSPQTDFIMSSEYCVPIPKPTSEKGGTVSSSPEIIISKDFCIPTPASSQGGEKMSLLPDFYTSTDFCYLLDEPILDTVTFTSELDGNDCLGAYGPPEGDPMSPLGLILSPTSLSWCSLALQSPETLSTFTQNQFI